MVRYSAEICPLDMPCRTLSSEFCTLDQAVESILNLSELGGLGGTAYIRRHEMWASEVTALVNLSARRWIVCLQ